MCVSNGRCYRIWLVFQFRVNTSFLVMAVLGMIPFIPSSVILASAAAIWMDEALNIHSRESLNIHSSWRHVGFIFIIEFTFLSLCVGDRK